MIVRKAFKYRLYPNREQQERYRGYRHLANQRPVMKTTGETSWLKEAHSQVLQQSLMNRGRAFDNCFEKRAGYPKFKSKRARQSRLVMQVGHSSWRYWNTKEPGTVVG